MFIKLINKLKFYNFYLSLDARIYKIISNINPFDNLQGWRRQSREGTEGVVSNKFHWLFVETMQYAYSIICLHYILTANPRVWSKFGLVLNPSPTPIVWFKFRSKYKNIYFIILSSYNNKCIILVWYKILY